jgi:hypothetical protein
MQSKSDLTQIAPAVHPSSRFSCSLNRWQEQPYEDPNDRNAHKKLNQRERSVWSWITRHKRSIITEVSSTVGLVLVLALLGLLVQKDLQFVELIGKSVLGQVRIAIDADRMALDHLAVDDQLRAVDTVGDRPCAAETEESARCSIARGG